MKLIKPTSCLISNWNDSVAVLAVLIVVCFSGLHTRVVHRSNDRFPEGPEFCKTGLNKKNTRSIYFPHFLRKL